VRFRQASIFSNAPVRAARVVARPARLLVGLISLAAAVSVALAGLAAPGKSIPTHSQSLAIARADTDSTALGLAPLDTLVNPFQLEADTTDSNRVDRYLPSFQGQRTASVFQREARPLQARLGSYWTHEVSLDSSSNTYIARETVGGSNVRYPLRLDFDAYREARLREDVRDNWTSVIEAREQQRQAQRRGGIGVNFAIPGGQQSAFSTIFGQPGVELRVNGQAYIQAGFNYRRNDQQTTLFSRTQFDPLFKQELNLGITGTIGDKLRVDVSWDTNNQFNAQNQLKLIYTGYEDEIIRTVEAGNVFLQTPSTLIRGGQSLFGIKSHFQLGGLSLTTVASQQEGQSNSLSLTGGAQMREFDLRPTDYEANRHFFLGYYFRNRWEDALSQPPNIRLGPGFEKIEAVEVWKLVVTTQEPPNSRQAVAMVDLGEPQELIGLADQFSTPPGLLATDVLGPEVDRYSDVELDQFLRTGTATPGDFLENVEGLTTTDYQIGKFVKLDPNQYFYDEYLGYLSLQSPLRENEALAVAYRYRSSGGGFVALGDFSAENLGGSGQTDRKLVLKLLRPANLRPPSVDVTSGGFNPAAWYLEMRNVYNLQSSSINASNFDLDVLYEPPGQASVTTLPGIDGRRELLFLLGLDRLNESLAPQPDYKFDFIQNTVIASRGLLLFPYLEPFGRRISDVIDQFGSPELQVNKDRYVFRSLYRQKKENAQQDTQLDVYTIRGSSQGGALAFYDLGAFAGVVQGSVEVTSGGVPLREGTDFVVDYEGGTVQITNETFLFAGRDINITWEQNQLFNAQTKTLLGARAEYTVNERAALGATVFQLNEKSQVDKFRLGDEPISNMIWGVDGRLNVEPAWLTQAVDALPFLQTAAPSSITLSGEFAQIRPGHSQTLAFKRSRQYLLDEVGRDFSSDELSGVSYLDDFEGFENTYSLKQPDAWRLSAAPDSVPGVDLLGVNIGPASDSLRTNWRGLLGWYSLTPRILGDLTNEPDEAVRTVDVREIFPERQTTAQQDYISTLDLYLDPSARGPYNYTTDLDGFVQNPTYVWGGITQRLPEGYNDFDLRNVEFVELILRPFTENAANDAGPDAKLYVDLGSISEDVLPNGRLNLEDGLTTTSLSGGIFDKWGRFPNGTPDGAIDVNGSLRRTEDLGLDGLASYDNSRYQEGGVSLTEESFFAGFLNTLNDGNIDPVYRANATRARLDPSGDDFIHYLDEGFFTNPELYPAELYPGGAPIQERLSRYYSAPELNSFVAQNRLANSGPKQGVTSYPDTEDLNFNSSVDVDDSYFQYEIPLSLAVLQEQARETAVNDYVVNEIQSAEGAGTGWYLIRIPVRGYTRKAGAVDDFSLIESIRLWTAGHEAPITVRIASFEIVGSQWQKSESVAMDVNPSHTHPNDTAELTLSSVNNEENLGTYIRPNGSVVSQIRTAYSQIDAREQSLVMRVEDLGPGQQRGIFKTYTGENLLKYDHLRMFVHMHGMLGDGTSLPTLALQNIDEARSKARLFVRIGSNETNDYYEYEQPLTPSSETSGDADALWQTYSSYQGVLQDLNSLHIRLSALNELKLERDRRLASDARLDSTFWSNRLDGTPVDGTPDVSSFAPPGSRIGVKGNPSLGRVNTIVIGIRNPAPGTSEDSRDVLEDVTVWVNELRASGYDETNGWAGLLNADVRLADFGTVRANLQAQTDGFGDLSSGLGERTQTDLANWGLTSTLNLNKFLPERFGWNLPVTFQIQSNTSTPRFSPSRGDIRLEEILNGIDNQPDLEPSEQERLRREAIEGAQSHSMQRSFTATLDKQDSQSWLLRNTVDGLSLTYSYADADARDPSLRQNGSWQWNSTASYTLNIRRPRTVRPFWFLEELPVLGLFSDLRFNYVPQSVNFSALARRQFGQRQQRPPELVRDSLSAAKPDVVEFPVIEQQTFTHRRTKGIQYNPFSFLNLRFDTNTDQNLNALGTDTLTNVAVLRDGREQVFRNMTFEQAVALGHITPSEINANAFEFTNLDVAPTGSVIGRVFSGTTPRTEVYGQNFTATFQPRLPETGFLNWLVLQPVIYRADFNWRNGPIGQISGASIDNQGTTSGGFSLRPQNLWRKFGFYTAMEEAQLAAEQEREAERAEREERQRQRQTAREREERVRQVEEQVNRWDELPDTERARLLEEMLRLGIPPPGQDSTQADSSATVETVLLEEDREPFFRLPKPNPAAFLRRTFLAITGMRDINVTFSNTVRGTSTNVGALADSSRVSTHYTLLDALRGNGPSLGYRFGFQHQLGPEDRVLLQSLRVMDDLNSTKRLSARTTVTPSRSLNINLNWDASWGDAQNYSYQPDPLFTGLPGGGTPLVTLTERGNNQASVWVFGASYLDMFKRQLDAYTQDAGLPGDPDEGIGDRNNDGRVVLAQQTLVEDFQRSFLSGLGTVDKRRFMPFPMPSWVVTYSGLSRWPILEQLTENVNLRHGYNASYRTDFYTSSSSSDVTELQLGSQTILAPIPAYATNAIRISESYSPLIGADITFNNDIIANLEWVKTNSFSLASTSVNELRSQELRASISYQRVGLKLPLIPGRLNNRISLSLTFSYSTSDNLQYNLQNALRDAVNLSEFDVNEVLTNEKYVGIYADNKRFLISPKIFYQFSNRVSADFTLNREDFIGDGRLPSFTTISGNFNIRVNISN
jgi:cell surface protein SprA